MVCDEEITKDSHKNVMKSVCYDYEEVSAIENDNVDKLINSAFEDKYDLVYKASTKLLLISLSK